MNIHDDDFTLLGLPARFSLDPQALEDRRKAVLREVHPDRFAAQGAAAQRLAAQWAIRINTAYRRLKDPQSRGAYLCELAGHPVEADSNTAMPREFLMLQMERREALEDADNAQALAALLQSVTDEERELEARLGAAIDDSATSASWSTAVQAVRALLFLRRFREDIERRQMAFHTP